MINYLNLHWTVALTIRMTFLAIFTVLMLLYVPEIHLRQEQGANEGALRLFFARIRNF